MTVDLFEFCRQSREFSAETLASALPRLDLANHEGGLRWQARGARNAQGGDVLELEIGGQLSVVCQRCLLPMVQAIDVHARYRVMRSEAEADAAPMDDDEFDPIVGSAAFDLDALVEDEVLLSLPVVPRHEKCPDGADLTADTSASRVSPFAVLSGFKAGGKKD